MTRIHLLPEVAQTTRFRGGGAGQMTVNGFIPHASGSSIDAQWNNALRVSKEADNRTCCPTIKLGIVEGGPKIGTAAQHMGRPSRSWRRSSNFWSTPLCT